ncbi:hypothetical protein FMM05_20320 [Flavobacterium zepuense]|uniref:Uncharacterized protein n=1 Tax=Flavobacterium zepuense TaxID=2593302 RepID=A0A552UTF6_9FLAO|nr:hypothetical protein [Flavobacterium zepuense]TRW21498.1 hypothetical protein FMM05_20320 [Flavobacterium zepuense]
MSLIVNDWEMERAMIADLILKELYEFHMDEFYSLTRVLLSAKIFTKGYNDLFLVAKQMEWDNYIELKGSDLNPLAKLSHKGILFCEVSSYAYPDYPIITHKGT